MLVVLVAQFFCGAASVTANSRMIYAFSRDGAIPGSKFWHRINPRTRTPTNAIWFAVVGAFVLGLPSLYTHKGVAVAFFAIVSVAVVGLYISYVMPVLLRRMQGSASSLGRGTWAARARSSAGWRSSGSSSSASRCSGRSSRRSRSTRSTSRPSPCWW